MLTQVGRYQIIRKIGQGGMAVVYLAHDPQIGRDIAIKIMNTQALENTELRARFSQEAQTIASLDHPCIVPIYDYGEVNGAPYLVMRHMAGGSLADWLRQGPLPLPTILEIMQRLAGALDEAHRRGIVHRDLKPGNILFDQRQVAFLSDFGIVKRLNASVNLTQGLGAIGTPAYMSPEQAMGGAELDGRSDIYSLGVVLFEMLTGQRPFPAANTPALLHAHVYDPVPALRQFQPDLPEACQPVMEMAMAKQREQRFATAGALVGALEPIAASAPSAAFTPPPISDFRTSTAVPGLSTTERIKRQIKRLPIWARFAIVSLAIIPLTLILFRAFADSLPGTEVAATRLVTETPTAVTAIEIIAPSAAPSTTPTQVGTLILLTKDDSAVWRRNGELALIPDDGLIPLYADQPLTIQANAQPIEMVLPNRMKLYLDKASSLQIDPADTANALTLTAGRLVAEPPGQPAAVAVPSGFYAAASTGLVGLEYDPAEETFAVDCLLDACTLVISDAQREEMAQGDARLVEHNVLINPGGARYDHYAALMKGLLPTSTPPIQPTAPATTPAATSTWTPVPLPTSSGLGPQTIEIGRSVNGRTLTAVRLGNGSRTFIVVGGTHAGYAPNTVELANQLLAYFSADPTAVPADATLFIIPNLNPDAELLPGSREGRLNAHGVDLNRNADCRWSPDPEMLGSTLPGGGGTAPFSEPETQALRDFIQQQWPTAVLVLAAHRLDYGVASPGACLERTLVSVSLSKLYGRAADYRFPDSNNDGIVEADLRLTGDLVNWLDGLGTPAMAVLLSGFESADFERNLVGLTAVLQEYAGPETGITGSAEPPETCGAQVIVWPTVYERHQAALGCAQNEAQRPSAAAQRYENGRLIWRGDTNEVYVLYDGGSLAVYVVDTAVDYEETAMLKGAFGQIWRTKPGVSERLGEPQEAEYAVSDLVAQDFSGGTLLNFTGAGGVYALLTDQNHWELNQE